MSRRLTPYLVAGLTGILSGVYIFRPLIEDANNARLDSNSSGTATTESLSVNVVPADSGESIGTSTNAPESEGQNKRV
ncbi:hypothetical protein DENSPDRAFT_837371 [Dentipellis sp. KUC8613]|nr:hypothetical protein DENSPDRAFT_837371 [Dentipellis sp. KUC8613]